LRDLGVVGEPELLEAFEQREPGLEQASSFSSLGTFVHLGFEQRRQIRDRGLLLPDGFGGHLPKPGFDRRELELAGVRVDQRLQRRGLRAVSCGGVGHRRGSQ
jgi:hypothetical protein